MRSILEDILLDSMYNIQDLQGLDRIVVNPDVVGKKAEPLKVYETQTAEKKVSG